MVIRVVTMPDYLDLPDFDEAFRPVLDWDGLGFSLRVHGQEFNSFRRATQSKTLRDFHLRPRETFLYPAERSIFGNGSSDFWTSKRAPMATTYPCAWVAGEQLLLSTVAVRPATD
jgi:hypothetical protein